jgi:hypothetical protein
VEPAVTADAKNMPGVRGTNRTAQALFAQFVSAAAGHDSARATQVWAECLKASAPWMEESELGGRLVLDLMD